MEETFLKEEEQRVERYYQLNLILLRLIDAKERSFTWKACI